MRILDAEHLVLQKSCVHPLVLISLHGIVLTILVFIIISAILIGVALVGMTSQLVQETH